MNVFAGKTTTERNKMIAAMVLGVLALFALYLAFGRSILGSGTKVAVSVAPSPRADAPAKAAAPANFNIPSPEEQNFGYATTPIVFTGGDTFAPEAGRNIFSFYEPPPPCRDCPTPVVVKTPTPATPTPTPPITLAFITPQNVYAGTGAFRLEVNGDKFEPDAHIYFNQSELPTKFVDAQKMTADIPANLIAGEGPRQIIIQTPDGKRYSNQMMLNVQAPPKPEFQYVGMIARKRYNNDTAYFLEQGKQTPIGARLNDVVAGRFRLVSVSPEEAVFEDVNLGFKHRVQLYRPAPGTAVVGGPPPGRFPNGSTYMPYNPTMPSYLPPNVPRGQPTQPPAGDKKDDDNDNDNDNDNGDN
jgi:hypothetical protein